VSTAIIAIFAMYSFILIGFSAKKIFQDDIHAKTLNLLSVYFLQPFLTFWGLMQRPIDLDLIMAPLWYLLIVITILIVSLPLVQLLFKNPQERSIGSIAALIGNTGNLGIPLGIAIFGIESVPYMTLINLMNVFMVYTFGVFFYSRGSFTVKDSVLNIIKLPLLWFAMLAMLVNINGITFHESISKMLMMGAYASMVVQLLLFGIYLHEAKAGQINHKLLVWVSSMKFIVIPFITYAALTFIPLASEIKAMIFMELFMPLAVANINLSSLYNCRPQSVTVLVFVTSLLFLALMFLYLPLLQTF